MSVPHSRCQHDRTPIFLRPMVSTETKEQIALDLIEPLPPGTPTTWIVPIRMVPKKGVSGWRMTLNCIKPNKLLRRTQNVMLTVEKVRLKIQG